MIEQPPLQSKGLLFKWTRNMLKTHGIRPRKRYSQSFVIEPRIVHDIIHRVDQNKTLIEIGSGLGTLSYYLSRYVKAPTIFFEIDERLASITFELVTSSSIVVVGDALDHEWNYEQVVSNTPYHITSDILVKLARSNAVEKAVLVLQREVVDRLLAEPGSREYGRITVLIHNLFHVEPGPVYPPSSFYPRPEVSSRLIVLNRVRRYDRVIAVLEDITRKIFSKRRKLVYKVLYEELNIDSTTLEKLGIKPSMRVYEVEPGVLLRLAEYVNSLD